MRTTGPTDITITMITETTMNTMENTMENTMLTVKTINMTTVMVTTKEYVTNETMVRVEGTTGLMDRLTATQTA